MKIELSVQTQIYLILTLFYFFLIQCNIPVYMLFKTSAVFIAYVYLCLLYTSDAADDMQCVDLGGRRIIKKSERI